VMICVVVPICARAVAGRRRARRESASRTKRRVDISLRDPIRTTSRLGGLY